MRRFIFQDHAVVSPRSCGSSDASMACTYVAHPLEQAALDKTDEDRIAMSSLLGYLHMHEIISVEQTKKGFDRLYEVRRCPGPSAVDVETLSVGLHDEIRHVTWTIPCNRWNISCHVYLRRSDSGLTSHLTSFPSPPLYLQCACYTNADMGMLFTVYCSRLPAPVLLLTVKLTGVSAHACLVCIRCRLCRIWSSIPQLLRRSWRSSLSRRYRTVACPTIMCLQLLRVSRKEMGLRTGALTMRAVHRG